MLAFHVFGMHVARTCRVSSLSYIGAYYMTIRYIAHIVHVVHMD